MTKSFFIKLIIVTCLLVPAIALADTFGSGLLHQSVEGVGLEESLETSVANIISAVLTIVGTIFLILTVVAGIMWMTAAGNEERIAKAKKIIVAATIGLFVVMSAYTITYFVTKKVGGGGGGGDGTATVTCSSLDGTCKVECDEMAFESINYSATDCSGTEVCCTIE